MPNWCSNDLEIWVDDRDDEEMKQLNDFQDKSIKIKTKVADDGHTYSEELLTFQGIIPRPNTLDITSGSNVSEAISYLQALDGDLSDVHEAIKSREWLIRDGVFKKTDKLSLKVKKYLTYLEDKIEVNDLTEARLALDNIKDHGAKDWYDWNIKNWGTKWDAGQVNHYDHYDGNLTVSFDTAWSPPIPWLQAVTEKYPLLNIKMRVTEESDAFIGIITAHGGEVIPNITDVEYPN